MRHWYKYHAPTAAPPATADKLHRNTQIIIMVKLRLNANGLPQCSRCIRVRQESARKSVQVNRKNISESNWVCQLQLFKIVNWKNWLEPVESTQHDHLTKPHTHVRQYNFLCQRRQQQWRWDFFSREQYMKKCIRAISFNGSRLSRSGENIFVMNANAYNTLAI